MRYHFRPVRGYEGKATWFEVPAGMQVAANVYAGSYPGPGRVVVTEMLRSPKLEAESNVYDIVPDGRGGWRAQFVREHREGR